MSSGSDNEELSGFEASGYATILKRPKPNLSGTDSKSDGSPVNENGKVSPQPPVSFGEWRDPIDSSSGTEGESDDVPDDVIVIRRRQKEVSRSHSDLSHRLSSSSDWSELSARLSRNSADLEKFFNEMGLDKTVLDTVLSTQCSSRAASDMPLFESLSSIDSQECRSVHSCDSKVSDTGINVTIPGDLPANTSVTERNARIIKWLCNMKRTTYKKPSSN